MKDSEVVDAFIAHLRSHGYPNLKVDSRPDQDNRVTTDIDAIAGHFAIEHTSMDTLPNQRRDSHWFSQVVKNLESEFRSLLAFRLVITLDYDAVLKGQKWAAINDVLRTWIKDHASGIPDGRTDLENVAGIPFRLHVTKGGELSSGLYFAWFAPEDDSLSERTRDTLEWKALKLAPYHSEGKTAVLIVESDDIALMNSSKMIKAVQEAIPNGLPSGVDQVWFVNTSIGGSIYFENFTEELL